MTVSYFVRWVQNLLLNFKGHINNLYNTTFWALIQIGGVDAKSAEKELSVSSSDCKSV